MKVTPTDPAAMVTDAVDAHSTLVEARGISLQTGSEAVGLRALADRERIAQVFSNLVGNALQFTPRGGRVKIGASPAAAGVRFFVEDTGPGIAPEYLACVFDRFWHAQNKSRRGSGLGLSIAKAIVEAHGGCIGVESTLGAWRPLPLHTARRRAGTVIIACVGHDDPLMMTTSATRRSRSSFSRWSRRKSQVCSSRRIRSAASARRR